MKTITKKITIQRTGTISIMDTGVHCAPKCIHFVSSRHCALKSAFLGENLEILESNERGLCLRTKYCIDTFGECKTQLMCAAMAMDKMPYIEIKAWYRDWLYTVRALKSRNKRCHFFCAYHFSHHADGTDYCIIQEKMEKLGKTAGSPEKTNCKRTKFCIKTFGNGDQE